MTEPLSSFGLTSISVAELGAFIQTQYNHQVSALELMTTATALSLAQTIVEGAAVGRSVGSGGRTGRFGRRVPAGHASGAQKKLSLFEPARGSLSERRILAGRQRRRIRGSPDACRCDEGHDRVGPLNRMARSSASQHPVPPLAGALPPDCQRDLTALRRVVRTTLEDASPLDPVSPADFRHVLVTGATGFVGRFLVRDLLAHESELTVHCVVRGRIGGNAASSDCAPTWNTRKPGTMRSHRESTFTPVMSRSPASDFRGAGLWTALPGNRRCLPPCGRPEPDRVLPVPPPGQRSRSARCPPAVSEHPPQAPVSRLDHGCVPRVRVLLCRRISRLPHRRPCAAGPGSDEEDDAARVARVFLEQARGGTSRTIRASGGPCRRRSSVSGKQPWPPPATPSRTPPHSLSSRRRSRSE